MAEIYFVNTISSDPMLRTCFCNREEGTIEIAMVGSKSSFDVRPELTDHSKSTFKERSCRVGVAVDLPRPLPLYPPRRKTKRGPL
ncbi:hypothetical protein [Antarctobacter jejuensis]|uniref:hypothetical protein n=1 Tax=Antarctobacter jejuensis TaxID=1439938 RepID=UPI003FCF592A